MSDIHALHAGKFIAIEAKQPGKKPNKAQQDFIDHVNANGGYAFWTDDMAAIDELIGELTT